MLVSHGYSPGVCLEAHVSMLLCSSVVCSFGNRSVQLGITVEVDDVSYQLVKTVQVATSGIRCAIYSAW